MQSRHAVWERLGEYLACAALPSAETAGPGARTLAVLRARTLPRRRGGGRAIACGSCTGGGTKAGKHGSCVTMSPAALRGSRSGAPRTAWASPRF